MTDETPTTDPTDEPTIELTRRQTIGAATGIATLGAAGFLTGRAAAQVGSPSGEIGSLSDPYLLAWTERISFVARSSAVSSISSSDHAALYVRGDL